MMEEQMTLFRSLKPLFANKPILVAVNKIDVVRLEALAPEKKAFFESFEKENIPIFQMSTVTLEGIMDLRNEACDQLLANRVELKLKGKKVSGVLNRVHVAEPTPRDNKNRPPCIPVAVFQKNLGDGKPAVIGLRSRKLEREIELEMGDDYILDLKKHYDMPEDQKYDKIPEIWQGHNIADFIDPDIMKKLDALEKEEELREKAGLYDFDKEDDSEEAIEFRRQADELRSKQLVIMRMSREKRASSKPRLPRSAKKRERSTSRFQNEMGSLGVDVKVKRMRYMSETGNRSRSLSTVRGRSTDSTKDRTHSRSVSRHKTGLPDDKTREKAFTIAKKAQLKGSRQAKVGESDRRIYTKMPKHLFSGKRGMGKTDRR